MFDENVNIHLMNSASFQSVQKTFLISEHNFSKKKKKKSFFLKLSCLPVKKAPCYVRDHFSETFFWQLAFL